MSVSGPGNYPFLYKEKGPLKTHLSVRGGLLKRLALAFVVEVNGPGERPVRVREAHEEVRAAGPDVEGLARTKRM